MKQSGLRGRAMNVGWKVLLAAALPSGVAWAQEDCRNDEDCGHGFRCLQTSANTSVTGTGGSSQVECGDGICEGGVEDPDSCPADCDTISYCAPAECDSNADCAEGYECGDEVGGNSSFTSAGGSTSSVCGDDNCDLHENNDNCPEDCPVFRYCQPRQMYCTSDADCAEGFYCDFGGGSNSVGSVAVSNVDSGTNGSDTATDGSDGTDGAAPSFTPPADTTGGTGSDGLGVCLVESSDTNNSSGGDGSSNNTVSGPTDSSATGADTGSSAGNNNGAGGASAVGGEGSPTNAIGSGSDGDTGSGNDSGGNATGSDGGGAGGSDPDAGGDGGGDDDGGCSCAVVGVPASSGFLGTLLLGIAVGIRRRRTRS